MGCHSRLGHTSGSNIQGIGKGKKGKKAKGLRRMRQSRCAVVIDYAASKQGVEKWCNRLVTWDLGAGEDAHRRAVGVMRAMRAMRAYLCAIRAIRATFDRACVCVCVCVERSRK